MSIDTKIVTSNDHPVTPTYRAWVDGQPANVMTGEQILALGREGAAVSVFLDGQWMRLELVPGAWTPTTDDPEPDHESCKHDWYIENPGGDDYEVDVEVHYDGAFIYVRHEGDAGTGKYRIAVKAPEALQLARALVTAAEAALEAAHE